jgi:hypothetical protein
VHNYYLCDLIAKFSWAQARKIPKYGPGPVLLIYVLCFGCHVTHSWQLEASVKRILTAYHRNNHTVTFNLVHTMEEK